MGRRRVAGWGVVVRGGAWRGVAGRALGGKEVAVEVEMLASRNGGPALEISQQRASWQLARS